MGAPSIKYYCPYPLRGRRGTGYLSTSSGQHMDHIQQELFIFRKSFDNNLESLRVYQKITNKSSRVSMIVSMMSSSTQKTHWSQLSGLSFADVSSISIAALPLFSSNLETLLSSRRMEKFESTNLMLSILNGLVLGNYMDEREICWDRIRGVPAKAGSNIT